MKFYQIRSTEKGKQPARWYRVLVPSGITFSQLYVLLAYIHDNLIWLSQYYDYETRDREIRLEEFVDGEPEFTGSSDDIYDTKGTYIDTFFKKGFRISQYTGTDFDLTIEVEEDAREYSELKVPAVIKVSRAVAEEEGGQPGEDGELPPGSFDIVPDKDHFFKYAGELVDMIGNETIMHVSDDPVTPEESIFKGEVSRRLDSLHNAMLPLYEDEELRLLIEKLQDKARAKELADDAPDDEDIVPAIDRIMIRKFGMTFSEYTFAAIIGDQENALMKMIKEFRNRKIPLEEFVSRYNVKDLKMIAEQFGIKTGSKIRKAQLAEAIRAELSTPSAVEDRLTQLEDHEMELFRLAADTEGGIVPYGDKEKMTADDLSYMMLAFTMQDGRLYVPSDVLEVYEELKGDELELKRQKRNWMYKCLDIASNFYGVMPWDILVKLFRRRFKDAGEEEIKGLFMTTPDLYKPFIEYDGRLMCEGYEKDSYYERLENIIQKDKPFYIPTRKEIEEFWDKGCLLSNRSYQAMHRFLIKSFKCDPKVAELKIEEFYHCINNEERLQTVVDRLQEDPMMGEDGAVFSSPEEFSEFAKLYMDMHNHTHMMANRGYTPNDLFNAMGGTGAGQSKSGTGPDEERVDARLSGEKRRKIGRNEPCPCGSGKKYKNCCGK